MSVCLFICLSVRLSACKVESFICFSRSHCRKKIVFIGYTSFQEKNIECSLGKPGVEEEGCHGVPVHGEGGGAARPLPQVLPRAGPGAGVLETEVSQVLAKDHQQPDASPRPVARSRVRTTIIGIIF